MYKIKKRNEYTARWQKKEIDRIGTIIYCKMAEKEIDRIGTIKQLKGQDF